MSTECELRDDSRAPFVKICPTEQALHNNQELPHMLSHMMAMSLVNNIFIVLARLPCRILGGKNNAKHGLIRLSPMLLSTPGLYIQAITSHLKESQHTVLRISSQEL